ncbi:septum formation protein [Mariniphaga anaerophila]|uniref:dTTP/UTP pyrophosphatase n=1 Tax=Mariniphaga anaerophila TaxID=1484053 RepID=A0A1M5G205_9BACT|nr:Maf family nucleotide pyrophosphatase [Mariniphaga anaerophila]SHF97481.1 septum formation protein [Mariniphaga anaerophila]
MNWLPRYNYILASKSPRRQELLRLLGLEFSVKIKEADEVFPDGLSKCEIPEFLALLKAKPVLPELQENDLLITADTIVYLEGEVLGKPANEQEAIQMLQKLSGKEHQVISGVCLSSVHKQVAFHAETNVRFKELKESEIQYYVTTFKPFDKAGAYGIQEWIGFIGITNIEGSFYNVMGLPIQKLYEEILRF